MKKHERCRLIASYISTWTYSVGSPPEPMNGIYLNWLNTGHLPSEKVIRKAIKKSEKSINSRAASK